ncbi:MAG: tRNA uracil 4-sulfurtransferase ThiI [Bacilli bacterium]
MEKMILIKYGELTTKKGNRKHFIDILDRNIKDKLIGIDYKIIKHRDRMFIESNDIDSVTDKIKSIFGIHSIVKCYKIDSDIESIKEKSINLLKKLNFKTFKIDTNRSYKLFPINSMEISRLIGAHVLKNIDNIKVDVNNPELLLKIEILKDSTYLYTEEIKGLGGYPVGIQGKGLLMLSGGIDSPVAGYLALKRGVSIDAIYFEALPHTSLKARKKVIDLTKFLTKYTNKINLYIIPFTEIQEAIYKQIDSTYMITIMRRMMYRISEIIAKKNKCKILINGESIGQVASQTLNSINVINNVTNMPIIRPVACMDKIEIINLAKKINTYETSILPYEDCCTIFVPKHPVINPSLEKAITYEKSINYNEMIDRVISNITVLKIDSNYEENIDIL